MSANLILKALQAKLDSSGLEWVKLENFHLDSRASRISLEISLLGEPSPVTATVRYSLGAENSITIRDVETNRPWMTEAIKLAMCKTGHRFELPGGLKGKMIRMLL